MIFYKYQLVSIEITEKDSEIKLAPAIFLGIDSGTKTPKYWVYRLDGEDAGKVDFFFKNGVDYVRRTLSKNSAIKTPSGKIIVMGKFCNAASALMPFTSENTLKLPAKPVDVINYLKTIKL